MPLTKEQIQQAKRKPKTKEVPVEELSDIGDGKLLLGAMPALKLTAIMEKMRNESIDDDRDDLDQSDMIEFLALSILDPESMEPAFSIEELTALAKEKLSLETLQDIYQESADLHRVSQRAVEDLEKNLEATPADDSGGDSPGNEDTPTQTSS